MNLSKNNVRTNLFYVHWPLVGGLTDMVLITTTHIAAVLITTALITAALITASLLTAALIIAALITSTLKTACGCVSTQRHKHDSNVGFANREFTTLFLKKILGTK